MNKTHRHICGDTNKFINKKLIVDLDKGCGHIFKHTKSKSHKCPKCSKYVTKYILKPDQEITYINKK